MPISKIKTGSIQNSTIQSNDIDCGAVQGTNLTPSSVPGTSIAPGAITTTQISPSAAIAVSSLVVACLTLFVLLLLQFLNLVDVQHHQNVYDVQQK